MSYQFFLRQLRTRFFFIKCCILSHSAFEYYRQLTRTLSVVPHHSSLITHHSQLIKKPPQQVRWLSDVPHGNKLSI